MTEAEHDHESSVDWFAVLDIVVWVAVAVIVGLAAEWLVGYFVREKIARGADRYLAKQSTPAGE